MGDFIKQIIPVATKGISAGAELQDGSTQRALAEHNAKIDELDAEKVLGDAHEQAFVELQRGRIIAGEQASGFASGGVVTTTGTPAILKAQEAAMAAIRASSVIHQGQGAAYRLRRSAGVSRFGGKTAQRTSQIKALTILGKGANTILKNKKTNIGSSATTNLVGGGTVTRSPIS